MRHVRKSKPRKTQQIIMSDQAGSTVEGLRESNVARSLRAKNVVDALFDHFAKWRPEVLAKPQEENI